MDQAAGDVPGEAGRPRPALHFAAARNWMNDPNGLIQWNGRFHLFYQHNPGGLTLDQMAWGHASSTDLWSWADHPLALEPSANGPDQDGCWSGCAVVHDGMPHVLYTGVRGQETLPCLATAVDQNLTGWSRSRSNPVIATWPPEPDVVAFRDHSAWRAGSTWFQVVGGGLARRGGALFLYRSADLRNWEYRGVLAAAADHGLAGEIWECPDVFQLDGTTVAIVSVVDAGLPRTLWMTGQITEDRFWPRFHGRCDGGSRYYAPQSAPLADGRRIGIGWLRESLDELAGHDRTRVGMLSLPRELYLDGEVLRFRPARELDGARGEMLVSQIVERWGAVKAELSARTGRAIEFQVAPVHGRTGVIVLRLRGSGCADIEVQIRPDQVTVAEGDRLLTSETASTGTAGTVPAGSTALNSPVSVYYDAGIVEVYSPFASPVAVLCDRDGRYPGVEVDLRALPGTGQSAVRVRGWSSGRASRLGVTESPRRWYRRVAGRRRLDRW